MEIKTGKNRVLIIFALAGLGFFLGVWVWKSRVWEQVYLKPSPRQEKLGERVVARVIDGDTIVLSDGRTVRYLGIDTPESGEEGFEAAKNRNEELVLAEPVRLEYDIERQDKYGRDLAYVFVGEEMINLKLLEEDLARIFIIGPNLKYAEEFIRVAR